MESLWKLGPEFSIQETDRDLFLFSFGLEADQMYVLDREPWLFNKSLLTLMKVEDFVRDSENNF